MDFLVHSHRNAQVILEDGDDLELKRAWKELKDVVSSIKDADLIEQFKISKNRMSLSVSINKLIHERLVKRGWTPEVHLFQDDGYADKRWRIDFADPLGNISLEVAFNHGEAISWNLLKPVMASELNHVKKMVQTKIGVVIMATEELKKTGAFDSAVGSYEKAIRYLKPMNNFLTVPMAIIGLKQTNSFSLVKRKKGNVNIGTIVKS